MSVEVLAVHDRLTVWVAAAVPVPVAVPCVVVGDALLVKVSVALAAPVVVGLNVTVKGTLWPAVIVTGRDSPVTVNTELLELTAITVTFALLAVRLPDAVPLEPSATLPTATGVGLTASAGDAFVPVPDSAIVSVGFEPFDVSVTVPEAAAAVVGLKLTLKVAPWPAVRVTGVVIPLTLNPVPLAAT